MKTTRTVFVLLALFAATFAQNNAAVALLGIDGGTPNILYNFLASNPALVRSSHTITGLGSGETLLAITKYPNSQDRFYAVSNLNKVYQVNATDAFASYSATLSCNVSHSNPTLSISFDPTSLQLNIVTLVSESTSNHFVADASSGNCTQQQNLKYAPSSSLSSPSPAGLAFYQGSAYVIDANANSVLSTISGGALEMVGPLNYQFSGVGGFAIASADGQRYFGLAALYSPNSSSLWAINLANGASFQAATLNELVTNLVGFTVMSNGFSLDYPFPYLGTSYNPNTTYTYDPNNNFNQSQLFGTQPFVSGTASANGNGNTASSNGNTGNTNGNTQSVQASQVVVTNTASTFTTTVVGSDSGAQTAAQAPATFGTLGKLQSSASNFGMSIVAIVAAAMLVLA